MQPRKALPRLTITAKNIHHVVEKLTSPASPLTVLEKLSQLQHIFISSTFRELNAKNKLKKRCVELYQDYLTGIAQLITAQNFHHFCTINLDDINTWAKEGTANPNIIHLVEAFHTDALEIQRQILENASLSESLIAYKTWIHIANECIKYKNFEGGMMIYAALTAKPMNVILNQLPRDVLNFLSIKYLPCLKTYMDDELPYMGLNFMTEGGIPYLGLLRQVLFTLKKPLEESPEEETVQEIQRFVTLFSDLQTALKPATCSQALRKRPANWKTSKDPVQAIHELAKDSIHDKLEYKLALKKYEEEDAKLPKIDKYDPITEAEKKAFAQVEVEKRRITRIRATDFLAAMATHIKTAYNCNLNRKNEERDVIATFKFMDDIYHKFQISSSTYSSFEAYQNYYELLKKLKSHLETPSSTPAEIKFKKKLILQLTKLGFKTNIHDKFTYLSRIKKKYGINSIIMWRELDKIVRVLGELAKHSHQKSKAILSPNQVYYKITPLKSPERHIDEKHVEFPSKNSLHLIRTSEEVPFMSSFSAETIFEKQVKEKEHPTFEKESHPRKNRLSPLSHDRNNPSVSKKSTISSWRKTKDVIIREVDKDMEAEETPLITNRRPRNHTLPAAIPSSPKQSPSSCGSHEKGESRSQSHVYYLQWLDENDPYGRKDENPYHATTSGSMESPAPLTKRTHAILPGRPTSPDLNRLAAFNVDTSTQPKTTNTAYQTLPVSFFTKKRKPSSSGLEVSEERILTQSEDSLAITPLRGQSREKKSPKLKDVSDRKHSRDCP